MSICRIVNLAYALAPLSAWRGFLIRRHIETCERCQAILAGRAEARRLLVSVDSQKNGELLWLNVRRQLGDETASRSRLRYYAEPRKIWKWALGLAALFAAVAVNLWVIYVRIEGENANAFVYQPQNSDLIIVWAGKD